MNKQTDHQGHLMHPIARISTHFTLIFRFPRPCGLVPALTSTLIYEPEYRNPDALAIKACMLLGYPKVSYQRSAPRKPANVIWK